MAHGADHEQEPQRVADKAGNADQDTGGQYDQSVEQLPRRHLATGEPFLGVNEHPETDPLHDEGTERAGADQEYQGPEKAKLIGNRDERGDFCADKHQDAEKEHTPG